jgi:hypothetical protein
MLKFFLIQTHAFLLELYFTATSPKTSNLPLTVMLPVSLCGFEG